MRFSILYVIFISVNGLLNVPKKSVPNKLKLGVDNGGLRVCMPVHARKKTLCAYCVMRDPENDYIVMNV